MKKQFLALSLLSVLFVTAAMPAQADTMWQKRVSCDGDAMVIDQGYSNGNCLNPGESWQLVLNDLRIASYFKSAGNVPNLSNDGKLLMYGERPGTRDGVWNYDFFESIKTTPGYGANNLDFNFRFIPNNKGGTLYAWVMDEARGNEVTSRNQWTFENCTIQFPQD